MVDSIYAYRVIYILVRFSFLYIFFLVFCFCYWSVCAFVRAFKLYWFFHRTVRLTFNLNLSYIYPIFNIFRFNLILNNWKSGRKKETNKQDRKMELIVKRKETKIHTFSWFLKYVFLSIKSWYWSWSARSMRRLHMASVNTRLQVCPTVGQLP